MRPTIFTTLALTAWLVATGAASAQTPITYSQDGRSIFTVAMPDFWIARSGGPRVFEDPDLGQRQIRRILALQPETNSAAWIGLASPEGITTLDDAAAYVANLGQFLVQDPVVGNRFETRLGGLPARVVNGQGTREGQRLRFSVVMADLPGDRIAVMVALAAPDADAGVLDEIRSVLRSIRAGG